MGAPFPLYAVAFVSATIMPLWRTVTDWRVASDPCPVRENSALRAGIELLAWDMLIAWGAAAAVYVTQKQAPVDWTSKVVGETTGFAAIAAYALVSLIAFLVGVSSTWLSRLATRPKALIGAIEDNANRDGRKDTTRRAALRKIGEGRDLWMARYAKSHCDRVIGAGMDCVDVARDVAHFVKVRAINNHVTSRSAGQRKPKVGRVLSLIEDIRDDAATPESERVLTLITLMLENGGRDAIKDLGPP